MDQPFWSQRASPSICLDETFPHTNTKHKQPEPTQGMKDLIMVGACYLDTILNIPNYPVEDAKLRATSIKTRRGGNCGNSLEVLEQYVPEDLGLHLVTVLPNRESAATKKVLSSFSGTRVDVSHSVYREHQTEAASCYVLQSQATGSRTILSHNDLDDMTLEEFIDIAAAFKDRDGQTRWHFEGRVPETTLRCIQHLRRHLPRSRISVEIERPGRAGLRELAREADVVFISQAWAEDEGYATAEDCLLGELASLRFGSVMLCTWGARGACGVCKSNPPGQVIGVEPRGGSVIEIVDAIGAGDTFIAGVLNGLWCVDWALYKTVRFAVDLATAKIQQDGFRRLTSTVAPQFR
ncbi:unnamed protein product [Discula destructiva]